MKLQFSAALIAAVMTLPVAAQAQSYIGASAGGSVQKYSIDGSGSDTLHETAYKVFGGYHFTPNYGLEAAYVDFGHADAAASGVRATLKPTAFYIAMTGNYQIAPQFSVSAKAGITQNHIKAELSSADASASDNQNRTTGMVGVGASYQFTKNIEGVVEYEYFDKALNQDGANLKLSLFSVGLRYAF
jgi:OOP family OmpA-OmpF porin